MLATGIYRNLAIGNDAFAQCMKPGLSFVSKYGLGSEVDSDSLLHGLGESVAAVQTGCIRVHVCTFFCAAGSPHSVLIWLFPRRIDEWTETGAPQPNSNTSGSAGSHCAIDHFGDDTMGDSPR